MRARSLKADIEKLAADIGAAAQSLTPAGMTARTFCQRKLTELPERSVVTIANVYLGTLNVFLGREGWRATWTLYDIADGRDAVGQPARRLQLERSKK